MEKTIRIEKPITINELGDYLDSAKNMWENCREDTRRKMFRYLQIIGRKYPYSLDMHAYNLFMKDPNQREQFARNLRRIFDSHAR